MGRPPKGGVSFSSIFPVSGLHGVKLSLPSAMNAKPITRMGKNLARFEVAPCGPSMPTQRIRIIYKSNFKVLKRSVEGLPAHQNLKGIPEYPFEKTSL